MADPVTCMFCLSQFAMEIRYDKRGKPYVVCKICFARAFVRHPDSLRGMAVFPFLLDMALEQRATNPAFREKFDGMITKLVNEAKTAALVPASAREPVMGLPDHRLPVLFEPGRVEKKV
jgi:transcription elongation factor Elf1